MASYVVYAGLTSVLDVASEGGDNTTRAVVIELLQEALKHYANYHRLKSTSLYQLLHSLELYELWLGRPATVGDLRSDRVNEWLCSLEAQAYSRRTVSGHRANICTLWRDCADRGVADWPRRVRRIGRPEPKPVAWTVEEVQALIAAANTLPGKLGNGVSRALYFETFLLTAWTTGLRRSDILALKKSEIRKGRICIMQLKTGHVESWTVPDDLTAILLSMPGPMPLAWPHARSRWESWFRKIKHKAGVGNGKLAQGVRVSAATDLKKNGASPEQIAKFLGHKHLESQRNYLDKSMLDTEKPTPTPLRPSGEG